MFGKFGKEAKGEEMINERPVWTSDRRTGYTTKLIKHVVEYCMINNDAKVLLLTKTMRNADIIKRLIVDLLEFNLVYKLNPIIFRNNSVLEIVAIAKARRKLVGTNRWYIVRDNDLFGFSRYPVCYRGWIKE